MLYRRFENYVNYAGSKTTSCGRNPVYRFENYVNYAGSKTLIISSRTALGLRTM